MSFPSNRLLHRRTPPPAPAGSRRLAWLLAGLAAVGSGACARRLPPPVPVPVQDGLRQLEPVRQQTLGVKRYQAAVRVRGSGPEGRFSATLLVAFERPDKLRVELLAPFGGSRWLAVVRGEEVTVLFPSRREFLRQAAVSEVLAALVGVRWEAGEVMAVLSGSGVPLGGAPPTCAFQEGETLRLEFGLDDGATQSLRLRGAQVIEASTPEYRVRYPTAWTSRRRSAPDRIEVGDEKLAASLVVSDLDINVSMDPELFRLEIPPGTSRVEVREIEGEAFFVKSAR